MRRQDDVSLLDAGDEVERMGKYKGGEETASCAVPCLEEPMPKMAVVSSSSTLKKGGEALSGDTRVAPVVFQGFSQVDGKTGATDPGLDLGSLPTQDSRTDLCKKAESVCGEEGRRIFDLGPKLFQGLLEVLPLCSLSMWKGDNSLFPLPTSRSTLGWMTRSFVRGFRQCWFLLIRCGGDLSFQTSKLLHVKRIVSSGWLRM